MIALMAVIAVELGVIIYIGLWLVGYISERDRREK